MDTTEAPLRTATSTPLNKSLKLLLAASTRMILAFGAMACAHSMSRDISTDQFAFAAGRCPVAYILLKSPLLVVAAGREYCLLKTPRSDSAFASSYASTMVIVCPAP